MKYHLNHLEELESESIFILREVAAQFENPVILFSGGKDSILMVYLAVKAFHPARVPFPLLHIDTGHNFPETLEYRDWLAQKYNLRLIVGSVQKAIDEGRIKEEKGYNASRNALQTFVLLDELEKGNSMRHWEEDEEMRKKQELKNVSSAIAMSLANGILKISDLNFGISSMAVNISVNTSVSFRSATGQSWMYGITSQQKIFRYRIYTSRTREKFLKEMVCCSQIRNT
jgi:hypothetical protein